MVPRGNSTVSSAIVDRHRFFASVLTRFSSRQRRGSTVGSTDFYHSHTTALPTCYSYTYTNAFGFELFINFILIFTLYYLLKRQAHMNTRWSVLPGRDRSVSSPGLKLNQVNSIRYTTDNFFIYINEWNGFFFFFLRKK